MHFRITMLLDKQILAEGVVEGVTTVPAVNAFRLAQGIAVGRPQISAWLDPIPGSHVYYVTIGQVTYVVYADPFAMQLNEALEHSSPHCGTRCNLQLTHDGALYRVRSAPDDIGFHITWPDSVEHCTTWEEVEAALGDLASIPGWHESR